MNKVMLLGRLTKDVTVRYTANNKAVANFSLAVNRKFAKPGEERQADFINIVAWDKLGEFCNQYFKKGQQVVVVGRIETGSYEKEGRKVYTTDVVAEEAYFAEKKDNTNISKPYQHEPSVSVEPDLSVDDELPF